MEEWSARVVRKLGEPTPEERSTHEGTHLQFRDWCLHYVFCRVLRPSPPAQANRRWCRSTTSSLLRRRTWRSAQVVTTFIATFCVRCAVAPTQCSKGVVAYLAAFLMGQLPAWGLASGALVLRAHQDASLTTLLDEIKAGGLQSWWEGQQWNRTSRSAQLSV